MWIGLLNAKVKGHVVDKLSSARPETSDCSFRITEVVGICCHPIQSTRAIFALFPMMHWTIRTSNAIKQAENVECMTRYSAYAQSVKGKERKSIYIAPFCTKVHTKRSGMDHTVLPIITPCLPFLRERSPDDTTTTEAADIQLQLTTHLSTPKEWKAELAWLVDI